MTNLRDRIAAVLDKHHPIINSYNDEPSDWCQCGLPRDHVADAVIAELGLRIQVAGPDGIVGTGNCRYVTDWETDD